MPGTGGVTGGIGGIAGGGASGGGSTGTGGFVGVGGMGGRGGGSGVGGGGTSDAGGSGAAGGADAGAIGDGIVIDSGTGGSPLSECAGLVCRSDQQVLKVVSPALGITQCACVPIPSVGRCMDCTCGAPLCDQYFAHCVGFSLEGGLLCAQNG